MSARRIPRDRPHPIAIALIGLVLVATAVLAGWSLLTGGLFGGTDISLDAERPIAAPADAPIQNLDGARILLNAQISQPRDPFRPLITSDSPATGVPGVGTPGTGNGNGNGFTPEDVFILVEIREVDGVLRATVTINGTSYDVGVGDTFADVYKVVSLDLDAQSGVFMKGDKAFTAAVGQQILK